MELKPFLLIGAAVLAAMITSKPDPQAAAPQAAEVAEAEPYQTYTPKGDVCECDCDCPAAAEIRSIVREELSQFRTQYNAVPSTPTAGNGSTGGVSSYGSTGGTTTTWQASPQAAPATYRAPVRNTIRRLFGGQLVTKVRLRKWASGSCVHCDNWLANEAPKLQSAGVVVTQIANLPTTESAPVIEVCTSDGVCKQYTGAVAAETILAAFN